MMKPVIYETHFGSITVDDKMFDFDIIIRSTGEIEKRKKNLSRNVYGTSHIISIEEARHIYEEGIKYIIIGTGQNDQVRLSPEAQNFFDEKGCAVDLCATPIAVAQWNHHHVAAAGMFHIT